MRQKKEERKKSCENCREIFRKAMGGSGAGMNGGCSSVLLLPSRAQYSLPNNNPPYDSMLETKIYYLQYYNSAECSREQGGLLHACMFAVRCESRAKTIFSTRSFN